MKPPKDLEKYMPSVIASARLMNLILEMMLCSKAKIKWELKLWKHYTEEDIKKSKMVAVPTCGTFSSGEYTEEP
jgi:hypothetical protein